MEGRKQRRIKCVVWDLDNTLWDGSLLEDKEVCLRDRTLDTIRALDGRGILQSIASKNSAVHSMEKLDEFGLSEYFMYPQINWGPKSTSIATIAGLLNLGLDSMAFIDDEPFEREEVKHSLTAVLCLDAASMDGLLDIPALNPGMVTADARERRLMYLRDIKRNREEETFAGPPDAFLDTLGMVMMISPAGEEDLMRAEELTLRTNQLNTTGYTYSYEELNHFRQSEDYLLLIASLDDRFGSYGKIGLALIQREKEIWTLKLLLMSCRVVSRGVGTILINHILRTARAANVRLQAEYVANDRNRLMYVTYKFAGFREIERNGDLVLLENDLSSIQPCPPYVRVHTAGEEVQGRPM
jgi:FkbH-like protein